MTLPDYEEFSKDEKDIFLRANGWKTIWGPNNWIREGIGASDRGSMSLESAFTVCTENEKVKVKMKTPLKMFDWNEMTMDQYAKHLEDKFMVDSSGTAKCAMEMVDFYKAHKDPEKDHRKILTAFLQDLVYCMGNDDGSIVIDEDSEFYVDAFLESENYEDFKNINKK